MRSPALLLILAALLLPLPASPAEGQELVGVPAPPLRLPLWLNSPPLEMDALRGKVVLIRWWTDGCSLCSSTAPALLGLQQEYAGRGLQLIGVFHPKPAGPASLARVRGAAEKLGFRFPIAVDPDWKALHRWWLDQGPRAFTSVAFLVDKKGIIRYVHGGGEFHQAGGQPEHQSCRRDFQQIHTAIRLLLAE